MRRIFLALLALVVLSAATPAPRAKSLYRPPPQTPGEILALINDYRAQNGLPAYTLNDTLSQIAQGQADYIASLVQTNDVHAGPGGTRPKDRAAAAGYGGGQQFFLSEIGVYGLHMQPAEALSWWKQSPDHNPTLIASTYIETGCGVATDGNDRYYYICDMGYVTGGTYTPSGGSTTAQQPAAPVMIPVTKAEPKPDGSVVHIIRTGQTLWTIAAVYNVPLAQILTLNSFSESQIIHPGDEVIVKPAGSEPTATIEPTEANTEEVTATKETATSEASPTARATEKSTQAAAAPFATATLQQLAEASAADLHQAEQQNASIKLIVGVSLAGIFGVFLATFLIQKPRPPEAPEDNDPFAPID